MFRYPWKSEFRARNVAVDSVPFVCPKMQKDVSVVVVSIASP